ncbi:MAG: alternative ribosome rescue aminoacyl-tRNA hydrolase ArfB [Planctomycetota bacterium]
MPDAHPSDYPDLQQDAEGSVSAATTSLPRGLTVPATSLSFTYAASTGPGGQNVNKRATKAVLRVELRELGLRRDHLARLRAAAARWLSADRATLVLHADEHRSRERNRRECLERLAEAIVSTAEAPKPRRATKPSRRARQRRLESKQRRSDLKQRRRRIDP